MISVIIPLYNKEQYIERAIRSVLAQSFGEFEIVVVNDGSTDGSVAVVERMSHPLIRLIQQENGGVSAARNRGIEEARFEYVAFLDADDEWKENHLEVIVDLINNYPACGVFGTSYYFSREGEEATLPILPNRFPFSAAQGVLSNYYEMASGTDFPIHMSSYAVRKAEIKKIGGFPVGIPSGEDIITLAKLHAVCQIAYSKHPTSVYYLVYEGKNVRPVEMKNPLDKAFNNLLKTAAHRKGVRRFVSSWHKRRMTSAIFARNYALMLREFFIALALFPLQRKLYTSLLVSIFSVCTGKDLYSINKMLSKRKTAKATIASTEDAPQPLAHEKTTTKVLVIIVSYNFEPWIERCLGSLQASATPADVLVVDNCSQDNTVKLIEENHPEVRLIKSDTNLGFGKANNIGMRIALSEGYDAVFLLNQDAWIDKDTLSTLTQAMKAHPQYGILSPVHLNGSGKGLEKGFAKYIGLKELSALKTADDGQLMKSVPFINAAFWMIPTPVLRTIGGFCPLFYHYGEDVDYVNRLRHHGYRVGYCPKVFGCHDREFRPISDKQWLHAEAIYHLTEYANINHTYIHALAYGIMGALKKSIQAMVTGKVKRAATYAMIAMRLLGRTAEVRSYRKQNQLVNANYL